MLCMLELTFCTFHLDVQASWRRERKPDALRGPLAVVLNPRVRASGFHKRSMYWQLHQSSPEFDKMTLNFVFGSWSGHTCRRVI